MLAQPSGSASFPTLCLSYSIYCVRTANASVRLCGCAGSYEPSLLAYVIPVSQGRECICMSFH